MTQRAVRREQSGWDNDETIAYYTDHRNQPEDLYPSERYFLPDTALRVDSCLDVGCAAGGFSRILASFNPEIRYVGVDVCRGMVARARRVYPGTSFVLTDGVALPFLDRSFGLVHSSGILHLNSAYREIVTACYAAAKRYLIVDFRISPVGRPEVGTFDIGFGEGPTASAVLPYVVLDLSEHLRFLKGLDPAPRVIRARGYLHPPSKAARISHREVVMAVFLMEKPTDGISATRLEVDLPCR